MQLRLLVGESPDTFADVVATVDATHTVGDLAAALAAHLRLRGERRLVLPSTTVRPDTPLVQTNIVSGTRCLLVAGDMHAPARPDVPLRRLVVDSGPDAGLSAALPLGRHVVGRAEDADVAIRDEHLSRRHLAIDVEPTGVHVVDLGSSNGTRLGSTPLDNRPTQFDNRALISAGASLLRLRPPAPPTVRPTTRDGRVLLTRRPRPEVQSLTVELETGRRLLQGLRRPTARVDRVPALVDAPGPRDLVDRARTLAPSLWERRLHDVDALDVRLGWTTGPEGLRPHVVQLAGVLTVVCDDDDRRLGALRWVLAQLVTNCGPDDLAVMLPGTDSWTWATWLPHATSTSEDARRIVVSDDASVDRPEGALLLEGRSATGSRQARQGVVLEIDPASGTATCTHGDERTALAIVDGIAPSVALELALALAPVRVIDPVAPTTAPSISDLLGGRPSAATILRRWSRDDRAPIGISGDGPVMLALQDEVQHLDVVGPPEHRFPALCTVLAALAASHAPTVAEFVLLMPAGALPGLSELPHVSWTLQGVEGSPVRRLRGDVDRRAAAEAAVPRLVVVVDESTFSAHTGLRELVDEVRSAHPPGVHVVTSSTTLPSSEPQRRLEVGRSEGLGSAARMVSGSPPTDTHFTLASVATQRPVAPDRVLVHDVVRGRVVEDSRTSIELPPPAATSELSEIVAACRQAVRDTLDRPAPARNLQRTFMFSDVVRSTALVEAIGDEHWTTLVQWHDETLAAQVRTHHGEVVDHTGDGLFTSFPSPEQALRCAQSIQRLLREHRETAGFAPDVRIGVHHATVRYDGRYRGRGVHVAARIAAMAEAGEILVSVATLDMVEGFSTGTERTAQLRGVSTPVPVASLGS